MLTAGDTPWIKYVVFQGKYYHLETLHVTKLLHNFIAVEITLSEVFMRKQRN